MTFLLDLLAVGCLVPSAPLRRRRLLLGVEDRGLEALPNPSWQTDSWIQRPFFDLAEYRRCTGKHAIGMPEVALLQCQLVYEGDLDLYSRWPWTSDGGGSRGRLLCQILCPLSSTVAHPQPRSYPTQIGALRYCRARSQSLTICLLARMPLLQAGLKRLLAHLCNNLHISILCYTALPR